VKLALAVLLLITTCRAASADPRESDEAAATAYSRAWAGWGVDAKTGNKGDGDAVSLSPGTDILVWFRQITPSHLLPGDDF
jgi:hypothetical protein